MSKRYGHEPREKVKVELAAKFDPSKPVRICYMGHDDLGWALGFTQSVEGGIFGSIFTPPLGPVEWIGGNIGFGKKTRKVFNSRWKRTFGVSPVLEGWVASPVPA